jgi:hypothetical protein
MIVVVSFGDWYSRKGKMWYLREPKMIVVNKWPAANELMKIGMAPGTSVVTKAYIIPVHYVVQDLLELP